MGGVAELQRLVKRLDGLHPDDAASVLAALSKAHRERLMEYIKNPDNEHGSAQRTPQINQVSPWLLELKQLDSRLTSRSRTLLTHHIEAHDQIPATVATPSSRILSLLDKLWRWWLDTGLRA